MDFMDFSLMDLLLIYYYITLYILPIFVYFTNKFIILILSSLKSTHITLT